VGSEMCIRDRDFPLRHRKGGDFVPTLHCDMMAGHHHRLDRGGDWDQTIRFYKATKIILEGGDL